MIRLKAGDRVRCLDECTHGDYTIGKEYDVVTFRKGHPEKDSIRDNNGGLRLANHDFIRLHFELLPCGIDLEDPELENAVDQEVRKLRE